MEKVMGIGGLFFRPRDPEQISRWYADNLGVKPLPLSYEETPWHQEEGPTVFTPFPQEAEYFGNQRQSWMINFRVHDVDAMVRQLRSAGIEVTLDTQSYPNGRFEQLHDPEDNPIELWEPWGTRHE